MLISECFNIFIHRMTLPPRAFFTSSPLSGARSPDVELFEFFPDMRADQWAPINTKTTKAIIIKIRQPQQPLGVVAKSPKVPKLSRIKYSNTVIWCPQYGQRNEFGANVLTMKNFLHFVQYRAFSICQFLLSGGSLFFDALLKSKSPPPAPAELIQPSNCANSCGALSGS